MFKKILVYLDGSAHSERILPYAIAQALKFGSKLILLRIDSTAPITAGISSPENYRVISSIATDIAIANELKESTSYLSRLSREISDKGLDVDVATILGPVADSIIRFIKDNSIDLVAMTSHAYKGWRRLFMGNAVDEILRQCDIPVLVIKPQEPQYMSSN